jgi:5-methyltetrahydrofolate--homocysteine methyltransferase
MADRQLITLEQSLQERIMFLDGAMGTMIQRHTLAERDFRGERFKDHPSPLKGNNDLLAMTRPEIIESIHDAYFEVGCDFATTNSFNANVIAQADYALESIVPELNQAAAQCARKSADRWTAKTPDHPRYVIGALGPTNRTASLSPDVNDPGLRLVNFDQLKQAYREAAIGLLDGGADILMIETVFDTLNAKAALYAVNELKEERQLQTPVMVSGTITDASGRTLSGQTPWAFAVSMLHGDLLSIGLNCALGAKDMAPHIKEIAQHVNVRISAHPNAGLPNEFGAYDQSPEEMAKEVETFCSHHYVNILGGCCGTTPEHIGALIRMAKAYRPRACSKNANASHHSVQQSPLQATDSE